MSSDRIIIGEVPGFNFRELYEGHKLIDRSGVSVRDFLLDQGIEWTYDLKKADILVRKAERSSANSFYEADEVRRIEKASGKPNLFLIAEPREFAPMAYKFAKFANTMAVSPGKEFTPLFDRVDWKDPELENWNKRLDRVCWIGRPTAERIQFARELIAAGVSLDIFSREVWPLENWKGAAADELETSKSYKYRLVFETKATFLCHSEKLFQALRAGCVPFFLGYDPELDLSFVEKAFLPWSLENYQNRDQLAPKVLKGIENFMFSSDWEVYSYKKYFLRLISKAKNILGITSELKPVTNFENLPQQNWLAIYEAGNLALDRADFLTATENYIKLLDFFGNLPELLNPLGYSLAELGQFKNADTILSESLKRSAQNHEGMLYFALLKRREAKFQDAMLAFEKLLAAHPESSLGRQQAQECINQIQGQPT